MARLLDLDLQLRKLARERIREFICGFYRRSKTIPRADMISVVPFFAAAFEMTLPFVAPVTIRARLLPGVAVQDDDDVTCVQCIGNPKDLCGSSRCDTRKQIGRYRVTLRWRVAIASTSPFGTQLYKIPEPSKARVSPRKLEGASANKSSGASPATLKLLTSPFAPIPVPSV